MILPLYWSRSDGSMITSKIIPWIYALHIIVDLSKYTTKQFLAPWSDIQSFFCLSENVMLNYWYEVVGESTEMCVVGYRRTVVAVGMAERWSHGLECSKLTSMILHFTQIQESKMACLPCCWCWGMAAEYRYRSIT